MFYLLAEKFSDHLSLLNVFHYISFRAFIGFLIAFFLLWFLFPPFLNRVQNWVRHAGGYVREYLDHHKEKEFIPSFGGVPIILTLVFLSFLLLRLDTPYPYLAALVLLSFGALGLVDDLLKLIKKEKLQTENLKAPLRWLLKFGQGGGLSVKQKLAIQIPLSLLVGFLIYEFLPIDGKIHFPFFKDLNLDLGVLYPLWAGFVLFTISTAVNLTDGLDGLAIGASLTTAAVFTLVSYLVGNYIYAHYLFIPYVPYAGELSILLASFIGAGLAFLWYNTYPAKVFMGDSGSLAIGALLGFVALATESEFILFIAGGLFLLELISVVVQIFVCRLTKKGEKVVNGKRVADCKRIFKMAPLHHHFEKIGWKEPQIVVRFWIISALLGVISLTLLKLR